MKVGILTMHRVIHFGSVLQAYALQQVLYRMGYDNEIIDYVYPNEHHISKERKNIKGIMYDIISLLFFHKREQNNIKAFISKSLVKTPESYDTPEKLARRCPKYDIYVTGSDQVWNTDYLNGDKSFFFEFVPTDKKKISYASSFGRFSLSGEAAKDWLNNLNTYSAISVRERKAREIILKYTGLNAEIVLDPTLLINKSEWESFAKDKAIVSGEYILVYVLTYAWQPFPYALDVIKHFEQLLGWKVVVIEPLNLKDEHPNWIYMSNQSPKDFVNLFKNAGLILTTSFHGTAFAINLERPFYSIVSESKVNDDRITSLCESIGCTHNLLSVNSQLGQFPDLDFMNSRQLLEELRNKSLSFLKNALIS